MPDGKVGLTLNAPGQIRFGETMLERRVAGSPTVTP